MNKIVLSSIDYLLYKIANFYEIKKTQFLSFLEECAKALKSNMSILYDDCKNSKLTKENLNNLLKLVSKSHKNIDITTVYANNKLVKLPVPCKLSKDGFYIPAKAILEALDVTCFWNYNKTNVYDSRNSTPGILLAYKDKTFVTLGVNTKYGTAQGKLFELSNKSYLNNSIKPNCLMCPMDFITENFNISSSFDSSNNSLSFISNPLKLELNEREILLKNFLEEAGYQVQIGIAHSTNPIELFSYGIFPSYYSVTDQFSYLSISVPKHKTQNSINTYPWSFKLNPDEAILIVGKTPDNCRYYSYRSYLSYRYSSHKKSRNKIFTSLGDALNTFSIKTLNSETPYDHDFITITTANANIFNNLKYIASCSGYCRKDIYEDFLSFNKLKLGLNREADEFTFLITLELFEDHEQELQYVSSPPLTILRITPKTSEVPSSFCIPDVKVNSSKIYDNTNCTLNNTSLNYKLYSILEDLENAIIKKYGKYKYNKLSTNLYNNTSIETENHISNTTAVCIQRKTNFILNNDDDYIIAYGVLHNKINDSLYSEINLYLGNIENCVKTVNLNTLSETASEYLPNHPLSKYLYVLKITKNNFKISSSDIIKDSPTNSSHKDDSFTLIFKVSIDSSSTDDLPKNIFLDNVIHFYK